MKARNKISEIELHKVGAAYLSLVELPFDSNFRAMNQDIYARLRDFLASLTGLPSERIQDEFANIPSRDPATAWSEYRAHGGKLDFTAWQEKQESNA